MALDAKKPGKRISLTDLFDNSVVLAALLKDKIIQKAVSEAGGDKHPKTCADLAKLIAGKQFGGDDQMRYGFEPNLLQRFAFHHVDAASNLVAVRLNVSWASEIYRFSSTQIGIMLPIPLHLKSALLEAAARRQGFLMNSSSKIAAGRTTTIISITRKAK